ncbi:MAG: penicillin-insensitive murein endopeptidase [Bdellovibrionales bacterium]|nr:penicillin-insensitive murein endopeptidase [Bdellovibrionales bacterium]
MRTLLVILVFLLKPFAAVAASTCYGTAENGRLKDAVQLPGRGKNFQTYSSLGKWIGRTYVHDLAFAVILDAYQSLETKTPDVKYVFGEMGWKDGGSFKPHRTHQTGLSVDFMTPARNSKGESVPLPGSLLNKFGYSIDFDEVGSYQDLRVDFEALAEHLIALQKSAKKFGIGMGDVILDPKFTEIMKRTKAWTTAKPEIAFFPHKPWVRHDEHFHVEFYAPCLPL